MSETPLADKAKTEGATQQADSDPRLARALIRSLSRGTAIPRGATLIHVGHEEWLAAQLEILREIAEDGYADTKFVRGAYGVGKSHFLSVVQEGARESGWVTSHIECHFDKVEIDKFETLYPPLVKKLDAADFVALSEDTETTKSPQPIRVILNKWTDKQFSAIGYRADARSRPFDLDRRLFAHLASRLLRGGIPTNFARALTAYALASLAGDAETVAGICSWLSAGDEPVIIPSQYLRRETRSIGKTDSQPEKAIQLRPINAGTVHDAMKGLLWLIKDAGYTGLVLCIDEVEELARLGTRKRQDRALQALREYVDHAGGDDSYKWLCMYLAATPEMFDSEAYFPRYDALASRIQAVSDHVNWRAPVIDLDKTPLDEKQLRLIATKIRDLYRIAHGDEAGLPVTDQILAAFVTEILRSKVRMARPRLLARIVIDELDRARSTGSKYAAPDHLDKTIARAAESIQKGE